MDNEKLQEIEHAAAMASAGKWIEQTTSKGGGYRNGFTFDVDLCAADGRVCSFDSIRTSDLDYLTTVSPDDVCDLVAEIYRLRKRCAMQEGRK